MANPQTENGYVRIATELLEALCRVSIPNNSRRVFDCILRKTYGYNKKEDWITATQIETMTGMTIREIRKALAHLKTAGMIKRDEKGVTSIIKDFELWKLSTTKGGVPKKARAFLVTEGVPFKCHEGVPSGTPTIYTLTKDNLQKTGGGVHKSGERKGKKPYIEGDPAYQNPDTKKWRVQIHSGEWVDYVGDSKAIWR